MDHSHRKVIKHEKGETRGDREIEAGRSHHLNLCCQSSLPSLAIQLLSFPSV